MQLDTIQLHYMVLSLHKSRLECVKYHGSIDEGVLMSEYIGFPLLLTVLVAITGLISMLVYVKKLAGTAPSEHWSVEYSRSLFPILLLVLLFRSFLYEPYRIPSGSMIPNLLVGDFILVDKFSYGLRWPVINHLFFPMGKPQRGDVMVFKHPNEVNKTLIKRVIGLPGDHIQYINKHLYINGELATQAPVGIYHGRWDDNLPAQLTVQQRAEQLDDNAHDILVIGQSDKSIAQEWTVPAGHYFMMGDNRDVSHDSRAWGFVPEDRIVGKASTIWMHFHCRQGFDCFDFSRIGDSIN